MFKRRNMLSVVVLVAIPLGIAAIAKNSFAQKASTPRPQDKLTLGEDEVKQLLLLVGGDKNGKITKARVDEFHGSGVRQVRQEQERRARCPRTSTIETARKPFRKGG